MREVKLGDIAKIITGKLDANAANEGGLYPFFTCSRDILRINKYAYDCECILVAGNGDLNVKYYKGKFNAYQRTYIIEIKEGVEYSTIFIYWFLQLYIETLRKNSVGSTIKYIKIGDLTNIKLPEISLSEQERIVALLDDQFAKIDALKANADQQLKAAKDLFQSALKEYLSPKEGWEKRKLGDLCKLVRGPFGGSLKKEIFVNEGYAIYEQQHAIYKNHDIRYYIPRDKYTSMKRFSIAPNDLIMSCSGTIGRIYVIPENAPEGIINQALLKITPKNDILPNYLAILMESNYFKEILANYSDGAAIKNIAAVNILKDIELLVPTIAEQKNILERYKSLSEKVKALQANYDQTITLCNDLKQSLLKSIFA